MRATEINQRLAQAKNNRNADDYAAAIRLYSAVLTDTDPDPADNDIRQLRLRALQERGQLERRLSRQAEALASFQQALAEARTDSQQIMAMTLLGRQASNMGQHDEALALQRRALQLSETINYGGGRALAFQGIGAALYHLGRYDEAFSYLTKALSLFTQLDDLEERTRTWNWLGIVHARLGEVDKSIHAFRQALAGARLVGTFETAVTLGNLGEGYQSLYDMQQALAYHEEALALAERLGLSLLLADLRRNIGVERCYLGDVAGGTAWLQDSLASSETLGEPHLLFQALYSLALAEHERGHIAAAAAHAQRLLAAAQEGKARGQQAKALHTLGLCAAAAGDAIAAEQNWQQALFLAHETGQQSLLWQIHAGLAGIAASPSLAITHNRIAAEVIDQIIYPLEDEALCQMFRQAAPVQAVLKQLEV